MQFPLAYVDYLLINRFTICFLSVSMQ